VLIYDYLITIHFQSTENEMHRALTILLLYSTTEQFGVMVILDTCILEELVSNLRIPIISTEGFNLPQSLLTNAGTVLN
jgi:hypothetical protein